ncbi:hypothetical protein [Lactococcus lactis]|uniref:hypothetical protein n=1 Tax=Lactococcus lactis TaxID=1358 RepID=UPI00223C317B|nr:hypothetical protein [Lactococcus lactis]
MVKRKKHQALIITLSVCLAMIFSWILLFSIPGNLDEYSVYYAQHLPHKGGTNPVMVAVFNNMEYIYMPNEQPYDAAGIRKMKNNNKEEVYFQVDDIRDPGYISIGRGENMTAELSNGEDDHGFGYSLNVFNGPLYNFSSNGTLVSMGSPGYAGYTRTPDQKSKRLLNEKLNEMYGQIVAYRQVPKINLQWIYNIFNYWRFN